MQPVEIKHQHFAGATRNPQGDALATLQQQFAHVRGPQQLHAALKEWGLTYDINPRQAAFWRDSQQREREAFARIAGVRLHLAGMEWHEIQPDDRARLWSAIGAAAQWGERLKGRW